MGLSKKLGINQQKACLPTSTAVPYKWSNQTYTVAEILTKFKFPCVVQCATDSCTVVWSDFQFDLNQPLLFYSKRCVQKMHAASLKNTSDILEEIGPPLAIPQDYDGWFGAAPKGLSKAKRHFRIDDVANSIATRFLVSTKCPAFTSCRDADGNPSYAPRDIGPGEVLRRVCVMESDVDDPDCPELVKLHGPCLECLDEKNDDVIVPLSHAALSYEVAQVYPDDETKVFQISKPIEAGNSKLPRILSLVHGDPPLLAYAFTGMVRCYSVFTEETILAATLEDPNSRCLELATDSCARFRLCLNEVVVKKTCEYANALHICENLGAKFLTGIKVSFSLKPEMSDQGDVDVSFIETASDMQEVEANSEFEISWGSARKARLLKASSSSGKNVDTSNAEAPCSDLKARPQMPAQIEDVPQTEDLSDILSDSSDSVLPHHRNFTEQEIVDLMLRKGLIGQAEKLKDPSFDLDLLKENRVTDNPLFYFFQRNPEQNPWKSKEAEIKQAESKECRETETNPREQKEKENPLLHLFQKNPVPTSVRSEQTNPLSYLFEYNLTQTAVEDKSGNKTLPAKHETVSPASSLPADFQHPLQSPYSHADVSQYGQVVCKTAKVYNDEHDDVDSDDENKETDNEGYSSESSEDYSDFSESPDNIKGLYCRRGIYVPEQNVSDSSRIGMFKNVGQEVNFQTAKSSFSTSPETTQPEMITDRIRSAAFDCSTDAGKTGPVIDVYDETEVVDDLVSLAETESRKDSMIDLSGRPSSSDHENTAKNATEGEQGRSKPRCAVHRVNNLLQEVSERVSVSSGRILDLNKCSPRLRDTNVAAPRKRQSARGPGTGLNMSPQDMSSSDASVDSDSGNSTSSPVAKGNIIPSIQQPRPSLDKKYHMKSTYSGLINSNPGLIGLNSVNTLGAIRRPSVEADPASLEERNSTATSNRLHKSRRSEPSISSIFSAASRPETMKVKTNMNSYHRSPRQTRSVEGLGNSRSFQERVNYLLSNKEKDIFSHNKGHALTFAQNSQSLDSVSGSSNRNSSSSDGTLSPKLVVITDNDLFIADKTNITDTITSHEFRTGLSSVRNFKDLQESEESRVFYSDRFTDTEHRSVTSEAWRPTSTTQSVSGVFMIQNADISLQEDYV